MSVKPVVVIDTQIVLRASINPASLPAKIVFDLGNLYQLIESAATLAEVIDVLNRPKLRARFQSLTNEVVARTTNVLEAAQKIEPSEVVPVSRDSKDDIFLALALEGDAKYLVTEDQDLLVLGTYKNIQIVNSLEFLKVLEALQQSEK